MRHNIDNEHVTRTSALNDGRMLVVCGRPVAGVPGRELFEGLLARLQPDAHLGEGECAVGQEAAGRIL